MISQLLLQAASGGGGVSTLVMLAGMFAIMYLFMIRPQMKRQKEAKTFREAVKKGDQVVTIGGIHGKVVSVSDKTVVLEFENGKARVDKTALSPTGTADTQNIEAGGAGTDSYRVPTCVKAYEVRADCASVRTWLASLST